MPVDYVPSLPPIPAGLTIADLNILREEGWGEDTVQTLITRLRINTPSSRQPPTNLDLRDFLTDAQNASYEAGGAVDATSALQTLFSQISGGPIHATPTAAIISVPGTGQLFRLADTVTYYGSNSIGIKFKGEHALGRGGVYGSGFLWTGAEGGTMFDFQGLNGSIIEDLFFYGGDKAKYLVRLREQTSAPDILVMPSSGVRVYRCFFAGPTRLDKEHALVAVGRDDNVINTLQASEHYFEGCYFQGSSALQTQGYCFRALEGGNTKNHVFYNCVFTYAYRGVHIQSGLGLLIGCLAGAIGYDTDMDAAFVYSGGGSISLLECGMENGGPGLMARVVKGGQGTNINIIGGYYANSSPSDDYGIVGQAKITVRGANIEGNSRSATNGMIAWVRDTIMSVGLQRANGGNAYRVVSVVGDAKTANAGGPAGTGAAIVDNNVTWAYVGSAEGNVFKIQATASETANGWGGVRIESCPFPYITTPITAVPLFDGSNNPLCEGDYARQIGHKIHVEGCHTGVYGSNLDTQLPDVCGERKSCLLDQAWLASVTAGVVVVKNDNGSFTCDVPYTLLQTNQAPVLCRLPEGAIFSVQAKVTQGVAGVVGPRFRIGVNHGAGLDDDSLIVSQDASAAAKFGDAVTHLGVDLAELSGGVSIRKVCFTTSTVDYIQLTLTKTGGAFGSLSAGNIRVQIDWRRLG